MIQNIALIKNPTSRLNQNEKENADFTKFASGWLGSRYCMPDTIDKLNQMMVQYADENVECIIVDGGDGTISQVMTGIYHAYDSDKIPKLVILPSGNTNLIAKDIGFGVRGVQALQRIKILHERQRLINSVQHRHALKIEWSDPSKTAILGMFAGAAAFTRAINIAHNPTILKNFAHDWAVGITIIFALLKLLSPQTRDLWLKGEKCELQYDQQEILSENSFLFIATTLQSLSSGMWPFWGGKHDDQRLHYLNVGSYPSKLISACWVLLRGKSPLWLRNNPSYQSGIAKNISMKIEKEIIMDGEHYDTGNDHQVYLSVGPEFSFVRL
ncbi:Phosphatidylglycerol kinase [Commensalibacter communis]|uniref:diacylglycerol/lipid kinase family protein n=1 Tax=Commensalibacter communis TaxID=2972786 RepID=UPI0022FFB091|nr:diacylglycerol kinase family protein [Commensalibacter communis]CAI3943962.1 Phosphatidylglycerol kinase [Commensalibacter communis]CAI3945276.1 Phosphatidylglycerol kinase [Commensalibacter communis]